MFQNQESFSELDQSWKETCERKSDWVSTYPKTSPLSLQTEQSANRVDA